MNFREYQNKALSTAEYPYERGLEYLALGLAGEAGEVADKVKKIIRDKGGYIVPGDRAEIAKEMGDVLWYLANLSEFLGVTLEDVAVMNNEKLASRKERGVIKGEGDNR